MNKELANCLLCNRGIKRGTTAKSFSTSPLHKHMLTHHTEEYQTAKKIRLEEDENKNVSYSNAKIPPKERKLAAMERQMSLEESISQKRYWEINDPRAKPITQKIMNMIAVDNQPFSISEDKGFIDLIAYLQPRYLIPSRRYFSDVMLPQTYDAMKAVITAEISPSNATYVSFTSDIWTCDHSNESYLSLPLIG